MTIIVRQRPLEETRRPNKPCQWIATASIAGREYTAISRTAPALDLARELVALGLPDEPMCVLTSGLKGSMIWPSFHKAASRMIKENRTTAVRTLRYQPHYRQRDRGPIAPKQGVKPEAGSPVPATKSSARNEDRDGDSEV